ncbi:MAG: alpha/beta hydrolase [Bacteroidales bacterium]|jgi:acetyl esterase/lipase|nr:alpha/beta hydrolase [Bacteroidales bacterium]
MDKKTVNRIGKNAKITLKILFNILLIASFLVGCKKDELKYEDIEYGNHAKQKLDISLPQNTALSTFPVMLCIHGGAWNAGDKKDFDYVKESLNNAGVAYVSINYRFIDDNANCVNMLDDIALALNFLKNNAQKYQLRSDKIALWGNSAGGHLALLYAYSRQSPINVAFVIGQVAPADFSDSNFFTPTGVYLLDGINALCNTQVTAAQLLAPGFSPPQQWIDFSPLYNAKTDSPPTILAYGGKDALVPYSNAVKMTQRLSDLGVVHQLITFPDSGHGLENDPVQSAQYYNVIKNYIENLLQ